MQREIIIVEKKDGEGNVTDRLTKVTTSQYEAHLPQIDAKDIVDAFEDFCKQMEWN